MPITLHFFSTFNANFFFIVIFLHSNVNEHYLFMKIIYFYRKHGNLKKKKKKKNCAIKLKNC